MRFIGLGFKLRNLIKYMVSPSPIPRPSSALSATPRYLANASALPRMMQFTTIRGRYTPNASFSEGIYACRNIWIKVTNVLMMTMYAGIWMLSGMIFLMLGAVRTAVFDEDGHRDEVATAIRKQKYHKILIIATSEKMAYKIAERLGVPQPEKVIHIEDIATQEEIESAMRSRYTEGKHGQCFVFR